MRAAREYGLTISAFRALPEVDRLLAVALRAYEDNTCPGCGQQMHEAMDPDLEREWTTMLPHRDFACTTLAKAAEKYKDSEHPQALRYIVGLREGAEKRKAKAVAKRAEREQ